MFLVLFVGQPFVTMTRSTCGVCSKQHPGRVNTLWRVCKNKTVDLFCTNANSFLITFNNFDYVKSTAVCVSPVKESTVTLNATSHNVATDFKLALVLIAVHPFHGFNPFNFLVFTTKKLVYAVNKYHPTNS